MAYSPENVPNDVNELVRFLQDELNKIKDAIGEDNFLQLTVLNVAPTKPQIGLYRADGVNWNPGAGAGVYEYNGTTYTKL